MCKLLVLALVAVVPLVSGMVEELGYEKLEEMENTWVNWKKQHGKVYSPREETYRRMVFYKQLLSIEEHNSKFPAEHSYTLGLNHFSDKTFDELKSYNKLNTTSKRLGVTYCKMAPPFSASLDYELPASVDWRKEGYVTPVKDQGPCGSCWAFSTTGSVEGQHFRKTGTLLSLSEQQMVDCSTHNVACDGGLMDWAFQYIISQPNGLETEDDYPYTANWDPCVDDVSLQQAPLSSCADVAAGDEKALQHAVATVGPISVAIDANHPSFFGYQGGIYSNPDCNRAFLDHGVLVVGYGTDESGQDYWIIKNSWSMAWGMEGYMHMARNQHNMCGISSMASYPIV